MGKPFVWYRDKDSLHIGGVARFHVRYVRQDSAVDHIYFRLKNIEKAPIRAIHMLNGPFILYCHVVPHNYGHRRKFTPKDESNREVRFVNSLKPGQTFNVRLEMNENLAVEDGVFAWSIDIVSQIIITRHTSIAYDMMIGDNIEEMRRLNTGLLQHTLSSLNPNNRQISEEEAIAANPSLKVVKKREDAVWATEPRYPDRPIHLVIVTHGLFSNLTADMLYLKDLLEGIDDNIVVKGFKGNAGKTERGVKKLGLAVADYVVGLIENMTTLGYTIDKISFVGHLLGGPVQLFAMKQIILTQGSDYFEKRGISPTHLVCLALPLLGVLSEMSLIISWFLDLGTLGKTGRDLTLSKRIPNFKQIKQNRAISEVQKRDFFRPLLETLPDEPLHGFLAQFKHLTVYANAINDGIVPLRTSALLYLDYHALGDVNEIRKEGNQSVTEGEGGGDDEDEGGNKAEGRDEEVGEIGEEPSTDKSKGTAGKYKDFIGLNFTSPFAPKEGSESRLGSPKSSMSFSSWSLDKKLSRRQKKFLKISARASDTHEKDTEAGEVMDEETTVNIPPKASAIESALSTIMCPSPGTDFLLDPDSRQDVIFHDKYYHFDNLPASAHEEVPSSRTHRVKTALFRYPDWKMEKQVKIAKKYHTPHLNWRKVLVSLPPDAHNNIIVRRRFTNGYGWGVVDHLCAMFGLALSADSRNGREYPRAPANGRRVRAKM